jgi:hypothetical protein
MTFQQQHQLSVDCLQLFHSHLSTDETLPQNASWKFKPVVEVLVLVASSVVDAIPVVEGVAVVDAIPVVEKAVVDTSPVVVDSEPVLASVVPVVPMSPVISPVEDSAVVD